VFCVFLCIFIYTAPSYTKKIPPVKEVSDLLYILAVLAVIVSNVGEKNLS